jgi:diphthine-ammonia ligase
MQVYVKSMSDFSKMNGIYGSYFGINPPARVTVEVDLEGSTRLSIDCLAAKDVPEYLSRSVMHVQGVSYWA